MITAHMVRHESPCEIRIEREIGIKLISRGRSRSRGVRLKTLLERAGFLVAGEACDGREAVRLNERFRPDVIILDIAMPNLNGAAPARELARLSVPENYSLTGHDEDPYVIEYSEWEFENMS